MKTLFICLATLCLVSCNGKNSGTKINTTPTDTVPPQKSQPIGGDTDEHGCKVSAGYTWSAVKNDCVRLWEVGVKLVSTTDPNSTQAAYIIFSTDSARVELFIPNRSAHRILDRMHPVSLPKEWVWSSDAASNGQKVYQAKAFDWVIEEDGKIVYTQVTTNKE